MPTIHRESGIRFKVFLKDHPPPHVHALVGRAQAKMVLPTHGDPARIVRIKGKMKDADLAKAVAIVEEKADLMWKGWKRYHG